MNVALWIVQVLLALAFAGAGFDQAFNFDDARRRLPWVGALPRGAAMALGLLEIVAAFALVVPAATNTLPTLTVLAAAALVVLMAVAAVFHARRQEIVQLGFSTFLGVVAAVVIVGRTVVSPF